MALKDMWSGDYSTSNQYVKYDIEVVENSIDTGGNTSNLTVRVWAWRTNSGYQTYGTGTCYCTIDGSQYTQGITSSQKITSTKICLFERTLNVGHNADGTKTVQIYAYISMDTPLSSSNQGGGFNLTTIARASQPTLSVSSTNFGNAITIYTNRQSTAFTHYIYYQWYGNPNTQIASGVTDSVAWTLPLSLMNNIPNATSGWGSIVVDTYNGSTYIGTKTVTFTGTVPSNIVPSFSSVTHSEATTSPDVKTLIGSYVQGISSLNMAINGAAGTYGSTITGYKFNINGVDYTGAASLKSNVLKSSGTLTLTATITDSRGRTAVKTASVTVLAYTPPTITAFAAQRANSNGTLNDLGTYLKITRSGTWNSLNSKNTVTINVKTSPRGTNTWTTKNTVNAGAGGSYNTSAVIGTYAATSSFDVRLEFVDLFNTTIALVTVATGVVTMSWSNDGVGIGKVWESGVLDVRGDSNFDGNVSVTSGKVKESGGAIVPSGVVQMYVGATAPTGFLLCQGQAVSRSTYAALFSVIGTTYGSGDGSTTFNLPNMSGRVPIGVNATDSDFNSLGKVGGEKTHTLTVAEIPSHSHKIWGTSGSGVTDGSNNHYPNITDKTADSNTTGGGLPHNNLQPYITLNFIIKT